MKGYFTRTLTAVLGLVLTAVLGLYLARNLIMERFLDNLVEKHLGYQVVIKGVNWDPVMGSIDLRHVTVKNHPEYESPILLHADGIFLTLNFPKALWKHQYELGVLEIRLREFNIVKSPQGALNYAEFQQSFYNAVKTLRPFMLKEYVINLGQGTYSEMAKNKNREETFSLSGIKKVVFDVTEPEEIFDAIYRTIFVSKVFAGIQKKVGLSYINPVRKAVRAII